MRNFSMPGRSLRWSVPCCLLLASGLAAQDATQPGTIAEMFAYDNAGFIGYLIVLMSVVGLGLVIENCLSIQRDKLAPPHLLDELEALFEAEDYRQAVDLCARDKNYLTNVVGKGLARLGHPFATLQEAVREMQNDETVRLFQRIGWLSLLAAMAPMMGLFGTVTGMFFTCSAIAAHGGTVNPAELASGIKMALITTIFGLSVAMPISVAFYALRNRVIRVATEVNALSEDLFDRFRKS
ncbi:MAG: MotA/TolQ/ExbB proton channel family protein [Planctomycetes bacterium]|nr:MotA/TolQ/ExbB proton channel family protein [Planctomycetota bacterium]